MSWQYNKIPKTCFFYWGNTKLSFLNYLSLVSFKEHNPDWKAVLVQPADDLVVEPPTDHHAQGYIGEKDYGPQALQVIDDVLEIDFEEILSFRKDLHDVQRADITRLYVLSEYGGMWSDMYFIYKTEFQYRFFKIFSFWRRKRIRYSGLLSERKRRVQLQFYRGALFIEK